MFALISCLFLSINVSQANAIHTKPIYASSSAKQQTIHTIVAKGPMTLTIMDGAKSDQFNVSGLTGTSNMAMSLSNGILYIQGSSQTTQFTIFTRNLSNINLEEIPSVTVKALSKSRLKIYDKNVARLNLRGRIDLDEITFDGNRPKQFRGDSEKLFIKSIQNKGNGPIISNDFRSDQLTVTNTGSVDLVLRGYINAQKIYQKGTGKIDIRWVNKNKNTLVEASSGVVKLAGRTRKLTINTEGFAIVDAQYLRATEARIRTSGKSIISVNALNQLFVNASDDSRVYYRGYPKHLYKNIGPEALMIHS